MLRPTSLVKASKGATRKRCSCGLQVMLDTLAQFLLPNLQQRFESLYVQLLHEINAGFGCPLVRDIRRV